VQAALVVQYRLRGLSYHDPHEQDVTFSDVTDATVTRIVQEAQADEIYILEAQPHVQVSFEMREYTATPMDWRRCLLEQAWFIKQDRFYQAQHPSCSAPFHPRSPYADKHCRTSLQVFPLCSSPSCLISWIQLEPQLDCTQNRRHRGGK
jgi:GDP-D-mannose dehydratase